MEYLVLWEPSLPVGTSSREQRVRRGTSRTETACEAKVRVEVKPLSESLLMRDDCLFTLWTGIF